MADEARKTVTPAELARKTKVVMKDTADLFGGVTHLTTGKQLQTKVAQYDASRSAAKTPTPELAAPVTPHK